MTSLLLDIGNSRLKWGVLEDSTITKTGHSTNDNIRTQEISLLTDEWPDECNAVIACNVAGREVAASVSAQVRAKYGQEIQFIQAKDAANGVTNGYRRPEQLGVDRWVALIGARAVCPTECLIVDAGTAITIDAMDSHGRHLGGQILPGRSLMAASLAEKTSNLPSLLQHRLDGARSSSVLASNTVEAIAEGILGAAAGAIERVLQRLQTGGVTPVLILTGGDGKFINATLARPGQVRPHLVLEGLARIAEGAK